MGRKAVSAQDKVLKYFRKFPKDFKITPNKLLFCKKCNTTVRHDRKIFVDSHLSSQSHTEIPVITSQSFIEELRFVDFTKKLSKIVAKDRNFLPENLEKYVQLNFNYCKGDN